MFGDNDTSRAVIIEFTSENPELDESERWKIPSVYEGFKRISEGEDFAFVCQEIVHHLTRADEIDVSLFEIEPVWDNNLPKFYYVLVACAVHYHFDRYGLDIPAWVFDDKYRMSIFNGSESEIMNYHGLGDLDLKEIGVIKDLVN